MNRLTLRAAAIAGIALAGYVGYGIYAAGSNERPPPPATTSVVFGRGTATGHRIATPSWTADFDRIVSNADQSMLDLTNVRHGVVLRKGKPYLHVRALHMTVNTLSRDFSANGKVHVDTVGGKMARSFDTASAIWNDAAGRLTLAQHITVHNGPGTPLSIGSLTFDVKTGEIEVRDLNGPLRFK
jgi:hypothetical protein